MQMTTANDGQRSTDNFDLLDRYWRAANYLSVGQIYLLDNALLRQPLRPEHIKPRLLGHWGTTPGLNFVYAHLNRVIRARDLNIIYVCGPGHGGPGMVANTYLEGTYGEIYPDIGRDADGLHKLFRQFSFPGGIPSHAAPETPGSINEGGELGYALVHAYGAAFDNPDLICACVVGDGEAETGPLSASWHSNKFLNPARDGAVLPILHLNGYKIANPTIIGRMSDDEVRNLFLGYGHEPLFVEGDDPATMHHLMATALDSALDNIRAIQISARDGRATSERPKWPMIVLRSPKGWTGPKEVDGLKVEGFWRPSGAHRQPSRQSKPSGTARAVDAKLPAGDTVRREGPVARRATSACPNRQPSHGRQSARQWRLAETRTQIARLPRLCGESAVPRQRRGRSNACHGAIPPRSGIAKRRSAKFPYHGTGRNRIKPPRRGVRRYRAGLDGAHRTLRRPSGPAGPRDGGT
jgi:phosphoketolase